jgi:S-adenosylmethionine decarboxylase
MAPPKKRTEVSPAMNRPRFKKPKLDGFNNLTKSLSFNLYDVCYAKTAEERNEYIQYIDEEYNATRLTQILTEVTRIIGANILNVARQDYNPQGASVTILISEEPIESEPENPEKPGPVPSESVVAHLNKSHICVHTYPESHPYNGIATFRADIDVSTCGKISPLRALNYLIHSFDADVLSLDYRVRGFTRDIEGIKHYIDHPITSIQNFVSREIIDDYQLIDVNNYQESLFHTKMFRKEIDLDHYVFQGTKASKGKFGGKHEQERVKKRLFQEIQEIFYGRNFEH